MVKPTADWTERSLDLSRLLARSGLGDRAAFATLYERTSPHLFAVVLRINRDRAQAEDILQEVYVNVWRAAKGFDAAQSQPLTWLTSIARNRAIDSLRRNQTRPQIQGSGAFDGAADGEDDSVYDTVADSAPGPLDLLSQPYLVVLGQERVLADIGQIEPDQIFFVAFNALLRHAGNTLSAGKTHSTISTTGAR